MIYNFPDDDWCNINSLNKHSIVNNLFFEEFIERLKIHLKTNFLIKNTFILCNACTKKHICECYTIKVSATDALGLSIYNHDCRGLRIWVLRPQGSNYAKTRNQYFYYVSTYILGCMFAEKGGVETYISSPLMFFGQHIQKIEDVSIYFSKFVQNGYLNIEPFIVNPYQDAKKVDGFPNFWRSPLC